MDFQEKTMKKKYNLKRVPKLKKIHYLIGDLRIEKKLEDLQD